MTTIFLILVIYQFKHFLVDYVLQSHPFFLGKFRADWGFFLPLLAHAGLHGLGTFAIARAFGSTWALAAQLAALDAAIHFGMDRVKASPRWMGRWHPLTATEYVHATAVAATGAALRQQYHDHEIAAARRRLRGNVLFWNCLGIDQAVHHLTHYGCIWVILRGGFR